MDYNGDRVHQNMSISGLQFVVLELTLLTENPSAHFEDSFETLSASLRILAEPLDTSLLYLILDFLPAATKGSDFGLLIEIRDRLWS
jgi:hypothetical protein